MVEAFSSIIDGYAGLWGITGSGMLILVSIIVSLAMAILIVKKTENKDLGIVSFFSIFSITALIGWVSWVAVALPLIVVVFLRFFKMKGGEN